MNKVKDIILSGLQDLRTQSKRNRSSLVLIFLSLVTYIGVNSHINSVKDGVEDSMNALDARVCSSIVEEGTADENIAMLEEKYGDDKRIREIFQCVIQTTFEWVDAMDVLYVDTGNVNVYGCYKAVFDYDYKGEKKIPDENEIIMPRYLCEVGIFDTKNLGDGDALIGETIRMRYETPQGMFDREFEFKVIGTYDNIKARSSGCTCYINQQIPIDMRELRYDEEEAGAEEFIQILEDEMGEDPNYEVSRNEFVGIYVSEDYDIDSVIQHIYEDTGGEIFLTKHRMIDPSLQSYFEYVLQIGNIISVMLLLVSVLNIVISSVSEVKERKWEFALKMAMGYTRKDIIIIFFVEKVANLMRALLLSLFVVGLYSVAITYITSHYLEYWKREYVYTMYLENVIVALLLVVMAGLIGTLAARESIKRINITNELKLGE